MACASEGCLSQERATLEYNDLPPMTLGGTPEGAVPQPPALPDQPEVDLDDELLDDTDLDEPEGADDEPDDGIDQAEPTEEGDEAAPVDEVAQLREKLAQAEAKAKQAAEYEQQWAEYQRVQQQQAAEQYWQNAQLQAEQWFVSREKAIYQEAENAIAPVAYVQQQMQQLNAQRTQWFQQFHAQREQSLWQFAMQQALPNYAQEVADHYHLSKERVAELLTYPPDLIPREAERMARERDEQQRKERKRRQDAAKRAKAKLAREATFPGGGQGGTAEIELGSDDHYNALPWERVAIGRR